MWLVVGQYPVHSRVGEVSVLMKFINSYGDNPSLEMRIMF